MFDKPKDEKELLEYLERELRELQIEVEAKQETIKKIYLYSLYLKDIINEKKKNGSKKSN